MDNLKDNCPDCNKFFDSATGLDTESKPQAGDLTVCIECGAMLFFNDKMKVEKIPEKKIRELEYEVYKKLYLTSLSIQLERQGFSTFVVKGGKDENKI